MKKGFRFYFAAWAVLAVLFNVIAFVVPGTNGSEKYTASFWIGYGLIMLVFLGNLVCARIAFRADSAQKLFYNIPLITISYSALIASFVAGGLCMILSALPYWIGVVFSACVLAFFAVSIVKASAVVELVNQIDEKVKAQTSYIKDLSREAESLVTYAKNEESKAACKKVFEAIRYSDPISNPALGDIEGKINEAMDKMAIAVKANDIEGITVSSDELINLIGERNRQCLFLK